MTQSLEDYLETIYLIIKDNKVARVKDIAERLNVKNSSVNKACKELNDKNYIIHEKYGYIQLTSKGLGKAQKIFARHKLIKKFLLTILNVSEENSEKDACIIEHYLSGETIEKMEVFLSNNSGISPE